MGQAGSKSGKEALSRASAAAGGSRARAAGRASAPSGAASAKKSPQRSILPPELAEPQEEMIAWINVMPKIVSEAAKGVVDPESGSSDSKGQSLGGGGGRSGAEDGGGSSRPLPKNRGRVEKRSPFEGGVAVVRGRLTEKQLGDLLLEFSTVESDTVESEKHGCKVNIRRIAQLYDLSEGTIQQIVTHYRFPVIQVDTQGQPFTAFG